MIFTAIGKTPFKISPQKRIPLRAVYLFQPVVFKRTEAEHSRHCEDDPDYPEYDHPAICAGHQEFPRLVNISAIVERGILNCVPGERGIHRARVLHRPDIVGSPPHGRGKNASQLNPRP